MNSFEYASLNSKVKYQGRKLRGFNDKDNFEYFPLLIYKIYPKEACVSFIQKKPKIQKKKIFNNSFHLTPN